MGSHLEGQEFVWVLFSANSGLAVASADPAVITFTSGFRQDFFGTEHLLAETILAGIGKSWPERQQRRANFISGSIARRQQALADH